MNIGVNQSKVRRVGVHTTEAVEDNRERSINEA